MSPLDPVSEPKYQPKGRLLRRWEEQSLGGVCLQSHCQCGQTAVCFRSVKFPVNTDMPAYHEQACRKNARPQGIEWLKDELSSHSYDLLQLQNVPDNAEVLGDNNGIGKSIVFHYAWPRRDALQAMAFRAAFLDTRIPTLDKRGNAWKAVSPVLKNCFLISSGNPMSQKTQPLFKQMKAIRP